MPEVEKIKGYIYDDGNNISIEASVFEAKRSLLVVHSVFKSRTVGATPVSGWENKASPTN